MIWQCERILSHWLHDAARSDQAHGNPTTNDSTVFQNLNSLQILAVDPFGDAGRFATVTAEVLSLAAFDLLVATTRLQISVQFCDRSAFDSFVLLQRTHGNKVSLLELRKRRIPLRHSNGYFAREHLPNG